MRIERVGEKIGGIEQIEAYCDFCVASKLVRVHCSVSSFGSVFSMTSDSGHLTMLWCCECGKLYAYPSYKVI